MQVEKLGKCESNEPEKDRPRFPPIELVVPVYDGADK